MSTKNLIEGIELANKYRDKPGYDIGAEHDVIYLYGTDSPMSADDVKKMISLGFVQDDCDVETLNKYDEDESWEFYV